MEPKSKKFVIVDSYNLVHRAYHAYPSNLRTNTGKQVNAVFGYSAMLLGVLEKFRPEYIACAFDVGKPTWRHAELVVYKRNRKEVDSELISQMPLVEEVTKALNIPILRFDGFEADDVCGTISHWLNEGRWKKLSVELIVVTGDKDLLQLVGGKTKVWMPQKTFKDMKLFERTDVIDKFGFPPELVTDYKALVGDPSDNIPGVYGIGDVSGSSLVKSYGKIENVFEHINDISERVRKKLIGQEEIAYLSRKIATIVKDVPLDVEINDCITKDFNLSKAAELFTGLGFRSLIPKVYEIKKEKPPTFTSQGRVSKSKMQNNAQAQLFDNIDEFTKKKSVEPEVKEAPKKALNVKKIENLEDLLKEKEFLFSYDPEGKALLLGGLKNNKNYVINIEDKLFPKLWRDLLEGKIVLWGFDIKKFYKDVLKFYQSDNLFSTNLYYCFDLQILCYLLVGERRNLSFDAMFFYFLNEEIGEVDSYSLEYLKLLSKLKGKIFEFLEGVKYTNKKYLIDDFKLPQIAGSLSENFENVLGRLFYFVENPTLFLLSQIEGNGIFIDQKKLAKLRKEFEDRVAKLREKIYKTVGHEFNVDSPKQLSEVLFSELNLPKSKKKKTHFATNEETLMSLKDVHPLPALILEYRQYSKLLSTYVLGLAELVGSDGKIRTTYNLFGTTTGRLSSVSPNLQNIPIKTESGQEVRSIFVSKEDSLLLKFDYSQIELRILAHISKDPLLLKSFEKGQDIHTETAALIFDKKLLEVTKDERRVGKTVNFGIVYGQTPYGLSRQLDISIDTAAKYIGEYFESHPKVEEYMNSTIEFVKENKYVETPFGRRRYIYNIDSPNRNVQLGAQREAINMPIQGFSTGDIMKLALIKINELISKKYFDYAKVLLQVHDEYVFEISENVDSSVFKKSVIELQEIGKNKKLKEFITEIDNIMENIVKLDVKIKADASIGKNWSEMTDIIT